MIKPPTLGGSTLIDTNGVRFLITERPKNSRLVWYVEDLKKHGVTDLVRVCESSYRTEPILKAGINVHDLSFQDGGNPSESIVEKWLAMIRGYFGHANGCIAVHCVGGLGRAPVLVAVALIEHGMRYDEAISFIRARRHGAFNTKQIAYLERYERRTKTKNGELCVIM